MKLLSIIVPVYNEISTVKLSLDAIINKEIPGLACEVIIIESNSNDGTRDVVLSYKDNPKVKLILESKAQGKGHAVRAGLAEAKGDIILIQDADLEYDVNDYDALVAPIIAGRQAFVLGSRHGQGGLAIRKFANQPLRGAILNLALGIWLKDPFTMYKVFKRDCIKDLTFECDRFDFDWELLIKLVRKGYKPIEIPITYHSRSFAEGKKIRMWSDPVTWLKALIKYRFNKI